MRFLGPALIWTVLFVAGRFFSVANADQTSQPGPHVPPSLFVLGLLVIYALAGVRSINEWERLAVLRFGKYAGTYGPGVFWLEPVTSNAYQRVTISHEVQALEIKDVRTHDNVPIGLTAVITTRIEDPRAFIVNVRNGYVAFAQRSTAAVSYSVGSTELDAILHDRDAVHKAIASYLAEATKTWGIAIVAVELKDIAISDESIQEAMALKAKAQKEADAELVRAQMALRIARELNGAAEAYTPEGKWLRGLEALNELARSAQNNTILIPTDFVKLAATITGDRA